MRRGQPYEPGHLHNLGAGKTSDEMVQCQDDRHKSVKLLKTSIKVAASESTAYGALLKQEETSTHVIPKQSPHRRG